MPIDASIPLGIKPYQAPDIMNAMANAQAMQFNKMKMAEARRAQEATNAMREIFASGGDPYDPATIRRIMALDPSTGMELGKAAATMRRDAAGANKERIDAAAKALAMHRDLLASVADENGYQAWRTAALQDLPGAAGVIPATFSPAAVQKMMLDADKALKRHFVNQDTAGGLRVLSIPEYGTGGATVVPGSEAAPAPNLKFVTPTGSPNVYLGDERTGTLTPATVGGAPAVPGAAPAAPPAAASPVTFIKQIAALTPGMVTDDARTPAQQEALRARGATKAGANGPHVMNRGIDLKPGAFANEAELRKFYADKGYKVSKVIDERRSGGTGPHWHVEFEAPTAKAQSVPQFELQQANREILRSMGYDPVTKKDRISDLIMQSTSGAAQTIGATIKGQVTGKATPGMEAIGQLKTLINTITLDVLGGKLGNQISDADRSFIMERFGDVGNPLIPSNQRLKAWGEARDLILRRAGIDIGGTAAPTKTATKKAAEPSIDDLLKKYGG